jgi:hypothetical protein
MEKATVMTAMVMVMVMVTMMAVVEVPPAC